MPTCRDNRFHPTEAAADACVKHPAEKDFDNLSTESRYRARHRSASVSPTPATPLPRRGVGRPRKQAASTAQQPRSEPNTDRDSTEQQDPPRNIAPNNARQSPEVQIGMGPARQQVENWIGGLSSDPDSPPRDDLRDDGDNAAPAQREDTNELPDPIPDRDIAPGEDAEYGGIQDPGTPPPIINIFCPPTPAAPKRPNADKPAPEDVRVQNFEARDQHIGYITANMWVFMRALVWATSCAVIIAGLVIVLADRDAQRYP